jgi:hypothetical protein
MNAKDGLGKCCGVGKLAKSTNMVGKFDTEIGAEAGR